MNPELLGTFTDDDMVLIERARKALRSLRYVINVKTPTYSTSQIVSALIYDTPLRLDFKAHVPNQIGQAFIGPMTPLTAELFEGDAFTADFLRSLEQSVATYTEYLNEP